MKAKILCDASLYAFYFVRALLVNARTEFRYHQSMKVRRTWTAYKVGGGGVVSLGNCNQETAFAKASKLGNISFVDPEHAVIFYSVNL